MEKENDKVEVTDAMVKAAMDKFFSYDVRDCLSVYDEMMREVIRAALLERMRAPKRI